MARDIRPVRLVVAVGAVAAATLVLTRLHGVNPTTAALTYVVVILLVATAWGIRESTVASVTAVLCFNFFFLPPFSTLTIADPQNWIAFSAFFVTAVVASQLSGWARQRNIDALRRQRDLERLHAFSRSLLLSEGSDPPEVAIARRIADAFQIPAVAVYDRRTDRAGFGGAEDMADVHVHLGDVTRQAVPHRGVDGSLVIPITLGGAPTGALAILAPDFDEALLQSIANLAAIGLERARSQEAAARGEAARQSGELRAAVLDALAHEFKTPLTSALAAASDLAASASLSAQHQELVSILDEALERLRSLVTDAVRTLRVDAGEFVVRRERHGVAEVVAAAVARVTARLDGRPVVTRVPPALTVEASRDLVELALVHLVDNAAKYSPPGSVIHIDAVDRSDLDAITIAVTNTGTPLGEAEQHRVFERFYRGTGAKNIPGTGLGLAIVRRIAEAHGGTITVESSQAAGTTFTLSLPRGGHA